MKLSFREKLFALRMKLRYNEDFQKEYEEAKKRNEMFDALGVKRLSKGLVVYKNGRYVIE